jgi:hypothetical protein
MRVVDKSILPGRSFWAAYLSGFASQSDAGMVAGNLSTNGVGCQFAYPAG